jgi:hypothetical protein
MNPLRRLGFHAALAACTIALFAIAACTSRTASAETGRPVSRPVLAIVDWGIVDRLPTVGTTPSDTLLGRNRVVDPAAEIVIAERTTEIPACIGTRFGLLYRTKGRRAAPATIDVIVEHPEQVAPDGRRSTVSRWRTALSARTLYTGWRFDEPYELVAGTWTFILSAEGRELARQRFNVRQANCALTS